MNRFKSLALLLALAMSLLAASPAAAQEDAEDEESAELLRLARVAETVERDAEKAYDLYRQAFYTAQTAASCYDAAKELVRLDVRNGNPEKALRFLSGQFMPRYGADLSPRKKAELENTMRMLEEAGHAKSRTTTPLEEKVRDMFARFEQAPAGDARYKEADVVRNGLRPVGRAALPVLEKIILEGTPETAALAAEMYVELGKKDALPGLERMLRVSDPLVRPAIANAFYKLGSGKEISPLAAATIDRLLAEKALKGVHHTLRSALLEHLSAEEELARHLAGGDDASWWLGAALGAKMPGALERAVKLIQEGGEAGRAALRLLAPKLEKSSGGGAPDYPVASLGGDGARRALAWLLEDLADPQRRHRTKLLVPLARSLENLAGSEAGEEARQDLWRAWREQENEHLRRGLLWAYLKASYAPPAELLDEAAVAERFAQDGIQVSFGYPTLDVVRELGASASPFWEGLFAAAESLGGEQLERLGRTLQSLYPDRSGKLPPAAYDARWLELLENPYLQERPGRTPEFMWHAAARTGDPRFPAVLRRYTARHGWAIGNTPNTLLEAASRFEGAERTALLAEALDHERLFHPYGLNLCKQLAKADDPGLRALVLRVAEDPSHRQAPQALKALAEVGDGDAVMSAVRRMQAAETAPPDKYVLALMLALKELHLRDGIPYLLEVYRNGGKVSGAAATAMDEIRAYHERLAAFEGFAEGRDEERAEEMSRLLALLADGEAEIRRAAIIALAAMKRTDALPKIVALAKDDPNPRVREAALQAVEQMAR